jgi:hypothetical protein
LTSELLRVRSLVGGQLARLPTARNDRRLLDPWRQTGLGQVQVAQGLRHVAEFHSRANRFRLLPLSELPSLALRQPNPLGHDHALLVGVHRSGGRSRQRIAAFVMDCVLALLEIRGPSG